MSPVDWLQERVSPDTRRVMQHFEHHHTSEEGWACLQSIRDSQTEVMKWSWRLLVLELLIAVPLILFVFESLWQTLALFAFTFFGRRLLNPWLEAKRKPINWACRRLS